MGSEEQTTRKKDPREVEVGEKPAKNKAKLSLAEALELLEKPAPKGNEGHTTRKKDSREEGPEVGEKLAKKKAKTSEGPIENEINQLVREIREIEDNSAKLSEQLRQQILFTKRQSLRAVVCNACNARQAENTQRLDKLPQEVWVRIFEKLDENDLFPLALSCRFFRQKQKELVARTGQSEPESEKPPLALKTNLGLTLRNRQPASADYLRFCSKEKLSGDAAQKKALYLKHLAALHGHLLLLQEHLKPANELDKLILLQELLVGSTVIAPEITVAAGESSSSQSLLLLCFGV